MLEQSHYPKDSAARLMTEKVPIASADATIGDIERTLVKHARDFESINYVYIVQPNKKLAGVVSIKEIFDQDNGVKVADVMQKDVHAVRPHSDQEHVAYHALKNNIKAMPVVDKEGVFLGVVPSDQILQTLYKETSEDIARFAGLYHSTVSFDDVLKLPLMKSLLHRLPWLLIGLGGGLLVAQIIGFFEGTLAEHIILAAFIPLVVYMAGATGMQMTVFLVRDLALNPKLQFGRYFLKQLAIIFSIGVIASAIVYAIGSVAFGDGKIQLVLATALFIAILSSIFVGLLTPYLFTRFKIDPANASGPIVTIVQDIITVIIYFSVATALL